MLHAVPAAGCLFLVRVEVPIEIGLRIHVLQTVRFIITAVGHCVSAAAPTPDPTQRSASVYTNLYGQEPTGA